MCLFIMGNRTEFIAGIEERPLAARHRSAGSRKIFSSNILYNPPKGLAERAVKATI